LERCIALEVVMRVASLVFAVVALALPAVQAQTVEKTKPAAEAAEKPSNAAKPAPAKQINDGLSRRVLEDAAKPKAASPMRSVPAEIGKDSDDCHHKGKASDA
jgi:hypothetical protein